MATYNRTGGRVTAIGSRLPKAVSRSMAAHDRTYVDAAALMGVSQSSVSRIVNAEPADTFLSGVLTKAREYVGAYPAGDQPARYVGAYPAEGAPSGTQRPGAVEPDSTPAPAEHEPEQEQLNLPLQEDLRLASRVATLEEETRRLASEVRALSSALLQVLVREVS